MLKYDGNCVHIVDAKYDVDAAVAATVWSLCNGFGVAVGAAEMSRDVTFVILSLLDKWSIADAHMSMSNKLVHPTIAIVKIAAVRRKK